MDNKYTSDYNWEKVAKALQEKQGTEIIEMPPLPSSYYVTQVVKVNFIPEHPITATVRGVHFYKNKIKYDLELWLQIEGAEVLSRIYNVDSDFVSL